MTTTTTMGKPCRTCELRSRARNSIYCHECRNAFAALYRYWRSPEAARRYGTFQSVSWDSEKPNGRSFWNRGYRR